VDVARKVGAPLTAVDVERLTQVPTKSSEAYDLYTRGRLMAEGRDPFALRRALEYLREAVLLDPGFADAFAASASIDETLYYYGFAPASEALPRARASAIKALELDPDNAEAHMVVADLRMNDWQWKAAETSYRRAIELSPGNARTYHSYAIFLAARKRLDEALAAVERAVALDPFSLVFKGARGWVRYLRHEPDAAVRDLEAVLATDPGFSPGRTELAKAYGMLGRFDKARTLLERVVRSGDTSEAAAELARLQARSGNAAAARLILARLQRSADVPPTRVAIVAGALGEMEVGIAALEKAFEQREFTVTLILVEPVFDPFRNDPRFERLSTLVHAGGPGGP
jgi:Tfp pilus assembly protein PilF